MRFHRPRDLGNHETAASLDHWQNQFIVYIQRDTLMSPYLTGTWNFGAANMGFTTELDGVTAVNRGLNCKLFLSHLASFMTVPYHRKTIEQRSTSLEDVWKILRGIYNVEKDAETLMDIGPLVYDKSESYQSFYHKIVYLIEMNLAPGNITVNQIATGDGDTLTVTLLDMAALLWIQKIDPRLYERVKIEFAVQIKQGQRLSQLVPQIAKAVPGMLRSLDGIKREVVACISDLNLMDEKDISTDNDMNTSVFRLNNSFNSRSKRGGNRGGGRPPPNNLRKRPICAHCNWLKSFLKISEVDAFHPTSSCPRAIPPQVKAIMRNASMASIEDPEEYSEEYEETVENKEGNILDSSYTNNNILLFQKIADAVTRVQSPRKTQDPVNKVELVPTSKLPPLSDSALRALRVRALRLSRKAKSPRILVTFNGNKISLLVDEGAEINCMDADFARGNNISIVKTNHSATAAGNKDLHILGESETDIVVNTKFQSHKVPINLGRVTIIENLGTQLIMGEPGKAKSNVSTDAKNRVIFLENQGQFLSKPYYDETDTKAKVCRIEEGPVTLYPEDTITINLPENLHNREIFVTPRRGYADIFQARVVMVETNIKLENMSPNPIVLKKHEHIADVRPAKVMNLDDKENRDFKFKPTVKKVDPPDTDSIKVDPDNTMSPEMKKKFYDVNNKYKHLFTPTPGRYTGAFGDSDTSLQFTSPPVQTRKVCVPQYSPEMKMQLANRMDALIQHGILMTPEEVGVSIQFMSPSMLVPKNEE